MNEYFYTFITYKTKKNIMKKINLKKLSFKKTAVVVLNNQQMYRINGGEISINEFTITIIDFPITTETSTRCNPTTEGVQN
jgi:hypothetical protein